MDKETIKKELAEKSNIVLAKYEELEKVDTISVMNMAAKTVFLGSLRVYNKDTIVVTSYYNPFLFSKFPIIYNYFAIIISLIIIFVINIYNIKFVRKNILGDLWKLFW